MNNFDELREKVGFEARLIGDDFIIGGDQIAFTGQSHWAVKITYGGYTYNTEYHQGSAYRKYAGRNGGKVKFHYNGRYSHDEYISLSKSVPIIPDVVDVMGSLVLDAQSADCIDFAEFCDQFGYSTDSIKARDTYFACRETRAWLCRIFDFDALCELYQNF